MKKIHKYIVFAISAILFTSCESYTEDLNEDPNQFLDAAPELTIGQAQLGWAIFYGGNTARYAGVFANQMTGEDRQFVSLNNYTITANSFSNEWYHAYVTGLTQAKVTYNKAIEEDNGLLAGIALITEAGIIGQVAALWGDVPYSEAAEDGIITPSYDPQAEVYASLQSKLSDAIALVGDAPTTQYSGNRFASAGTWAEVAHSLKARFYIHTGEYDQALSEARLGIQTPEGTLNMLHSSSTRNSNLYYQFIVFDRGGYLGASDAYLRDLLIDGNGIQRSLETPGDSSILAYYYNDTELNTNSDGIFAQVAPFPIISYEEVKLIEAEAAYRTSSEGDARDALNEVRNYLADFYDADFPSSNASGDELLVQILEEKYISLFGQIEPFNDIRRTGNLIGVPSKVTTSGLPERFLYPQNEIDSNPNTPSPIPGFFDPTPINQ